MIRQSRQPISAYFLLFLPLVSVILWFFSPIVLSPDQSFFGQGDDALKNYYTPWYHAKHDQHWLWFDGMNYPHGDHLVFADAQPLVSNAIRLVEQVIPGTADHSVGILNLLMLLQILLTAWCYWRILLHWRIETHFAAIGAAAITVLSPQILRLNGHFALTYAFVIPLLWLLYLRAAQDFGLLRDSWVGLALLLAAWIHPYYLMIGGALLTALTGYAWVLGKDGRKWTQRLTSFSVQVILPAILFFLILKMTDPVTDRPANPTGMSEYVASWRTLFLPIANPQFDEITRPMLSIGDQSWEGIGYVGIAGTTALILSFVHVVFRFLRHRKKGVRAAFFRALPSRNPEIVIAVLVALSLMVFAMGFPFGIKPELLTEVFPPIKQFRSLGRFAWIFHGLWMTYLVYAVYRLSRLMRTRNRYLALGIPVVFALLTFAEGAGQWRSIRFSSGETTPQMALGKEIPWLKDVAAADYSCIVSLPWFHVGSENLITTQASPTGNAFAASIRTGLPLLNVMMSRTSLSQTWAQFQLATEPALPLEFLKQPLDPRPMLAIRQGIRDTFDGAYFRLGMKQVSSNETVQTYALNLQEAEKQLLSHISQTPDSLLGKDLFRMSFDENGDVPGIYGTKGKRLKRKDNNLLFEGTIPNAKPNQAYTISCWARLKEDGIPMTYFGVMVHDATGQNTLWSYPTMNGFVRRIEGEWALLEREVVLPASDHKLTVNITRWSRRPAEIDIDELSIRPSDQSTLHITSTGGRLVNNRLENPKNNR